MRHVFHVRKLFHHYHVSSYTCLVNAWLLYNAGLYVAFCLVGLFVQRLFCLGTFQRIGVINHNILVSACRYVWEGLFGKAHSNNA